MKICVLFLFLLIASVSFSQKNNSFKPSFRLITSGGMAIGQKKISPLFQVILGFYYHRFSAGIGAGYDDYRFHSIPLFADMRFNFGRNDVSFIYADLGYNFPFKISRQTDAFKTSDIYKGGFYGDFGMGFKMFTHRRHALLFSAGYSIKDIRNIQGYTNNWREPGTEDTFYKYYYSMGRIVSKLSWQFGR